MSWIEDVLKHSQNFTDDSNIIPNDNSKYIFFTFKFYINSKHIYKVIRGEITPKNNINKNVIEKINKMNGKEVYYGKWKIDLDYLKNMIENERPGYHQNTVRNTSFVKRDGSIDRSLSGYNFIMYDEQSLADFIFDNSQHINYNGKSFHLHSTIHITDKSNNLNINNLTDNFNNLGVNENNFDTNINITNDNDMDTNINITNDNDMDMNFGNVNDIASDNNMNFEDINFELLNEMARVQIESNVMME